MLTVRLSRSDDHDDNKLHDWVYVMGFFKVILFLVFYFLYDDFKVIVIFNFVCIMGCLTMTSLWGI